MSKGYNTTAPHTLKEQALKIMAERCHKGVRMAQIMPSLTWLDVKVFKESGVYDTRTDFFAYEWDEGKRGERKDVFWNICPERYYDIFQQSYLTHFDYSDKDIKKSGSHRPIVKFDWGFTTFVLVIIVFQFGLLLNIGIDLHETQIFCLRLIWIKTAGLQARIIFQR